MASAISVRSVVKVYGARQRALDSVSFDVPPNTVVGLIGENGSGKSTLMSIAVQLVRPTSGSILIEGAPYGSRGSPARSIGVGLTSMRPPSSMSAERFLGLLARQIDVSPSSVGRMLERTGLEGDGHRRIGTFSTGMRQRLILAAALLGDPHLLILDEPSSGLDPVGIRWLRDLIDEHRRAGGTTLISSHHVDEMARLADRLVILRGGRLVADDTLIGIQGQHDDLESAVIGLLTRG